MQVCVAQQQNQILAKPIDEQELIILIQTDWETAENITCLCLANSDSSDI